jgi:hypothetical protein
MDSKIKALLGEMHFTIVMLQTQLEAAQKRIAELDKPKEADAE